MAIRLKWSFLIAPVFGTGLISAAIQCMGDVTSSTDEIAYRSICEMKFLEGEHENYIMTGYGSGKSLDEANVSAMEQLARSISSTVTASTRARRSMNNEVVSSSFFQTADIRSKVNLKNAMMTCIDRNDPAGTLHVLVEVDVRSPETQIAEALRKKYPDSVSLKFTGNRYITSSQALSKVKHGLPIPRARSRQIEIPVSLYRQSATWYVQVGDAVYALNEGQLWNFVNLEMFALPKGDGFSADAYRGDNWRRDISNLNAGDYFRLRLNTASPGYVTVFNLYDDGRVALLEKNLQISGELMLPQSGVYQTATLDENEATTDRYLAICMKDPVDMLFTQKLTRDAGVVAGEGSFQLDYLLENLSTLKDAEIMSLSIRTLP